MDKRATDIVAYLTWVGLLIAFVAGDREGSRFHLLGWIIGSVGGIFCAICWFIGIGNAIQGVEKEVPVLGQIHLL